MALESFLYIISFRFFNDLLRFFVFIILFINVGLTQIVEFNVVYELSLLSLHTSQFKLISLLSSFLIVLDQALMNTLGDQFDVFSVSFGILSTHCTYHL